MKPLTWIDGRQGGDYQKKLLFQIGLGKFGMDCYLIKFAPKVELKPHVDMVKGKHIRMNYVYKGRGTFKCKEKILDWKRLKIFRPDMNIHSMINDDSERRVFSVGLKY